ncbi:MAG: DUF5683 domain-containing protein [Gemmatimonadota bacterium]|jgi:hypothetical protein
MRETAGSLRLLAAVALMTFAAPTALAAQELPEPIPLPTDTVEPIQGPSPAGAFVRSLLVPGWGQAVYGAYVRGGVFFALQSGSWFMLLKTIGKLSEARSIEERRVGIVRDSLLAEAAEDPRLAERYQDPRALELDVQRAADKDERVTEIRGLVHAREEQREDWIAMTIFVTLMSGVDALVNAHLADFPGRVVVDPRPDGRLTVGLTLPAGGKP